MWWRISVLLIFIMWYGWEIDIIVDNLVGRLGVLERRGSDGRKYFRFLGVDDLIMVKELK